MTGRERDEKRVKGRERGTERREGKPNTSTAMEPSKQTDQRHYVLFFTHLQEVLRKGRRSFVSER